MKEFFKAKIKLEQMTSHQPLCFISAIGGLRDFFLGLGFVLGLEQIRQMLLFQNYDQLIPGYSGPIVGVLFMIFGLVVAITSSINKPKFTRIGLKFQAYAWLFSTIMYTMGGNFILALVFGVFFSLPAGYLAYYYKHFLSKKGCE